LFFTFPEDARWNADRQAIEFGVEIGEYRGVVRVPRHVFQRLLPERPTPERCVEAYYLQRTRFPQRGSGVLKTDSCGFSWMQPPLPNATTEHEIWDQSEDRARRRVGT
jgi:hypothetical protein